MTTTHPFHVRSDHGARTRRPVALVAGVAAAAACAVVAISSIGSSGEPAVVGLDAQPVEVNVSNLTEPVSALLDGAAFDRAVNDAVAFMTNGSALLHGTGFADAVANAITAATD
jgi:hypothetical protein